jgi:formylmethanofuran dehydrogenase subunit A
LTLLRIAGGRVVDPLHDIDAVQDVWIENGRIIAPPPIDEPHERIDASGCIVMAGAIDVHTHVAGGNVAAARLLLAERYSDTHSPMMQWAGAPLDTYSTGALYALMGFTLVVEPALAPIDAVATHSELETIPYVDRAALAVLGNDDVLLGLIRDGASTGLIQDYVAWSLCMSRAIGIKAVNPGGVAAFKENIRRFDLDDIVPEYGVSARSIGAKLRAALLNLGVPHPLHLHTCNLGLPGSVDTALATIDAAEGEPLHLAHLQFYGYGADGALGISSGAARLAEAIGTHKNVTVDVGQVMFGPTVTISSDVLTQFNARKRASPRKWLVRDGDGNGVGVIPFTYRRRSSVNALQWAIGLELFLLVDDCWRVLLTTDHPNGGPFTSYPELLQLLMDRNARAAAIDGLPHDALETSILPSIKREYSMGEIAIMTRVAPARLLGLADRGHLGPGAVADVAVYRDQPDRARMFRNAEWVVRNGIAIVRSGRLQEPRFGKTLRVAPRFDPAIERYVAKIYDRRWGIPPAAFAVPDRLLNDVSPFEVVACRH